LNSGSLSWRAGISPAEIAAPAAPGSRWRLFDLTQQLWMLAITFVSMATLNATLYAVFAGSARKLLASSRAQRRFNLAAVRCSASRGSGGSSRGVPAEKYASRSFSQVPPGARVLLAR
jgi:hypothetical protein